MKTELSSALFLAMLALAPHAANATCLYASAAYSDGAERDGQMCNNGRWAGRSSASEGGSGGFGADTTGMTDSSRTGGGAGGGGFPEEPDSPEELAE